MATFVGRTSELAHLGQLLDGALAGHGRVIFITGDAGAGKSTLVSQFTVDAALRSDAVRIIGSSCSEQYGAAEPYQPFVEAFRDLLAESARPASRWASLRDLATELAPHWVSTIPLAGNVIAATMTTAVELRKLGGPAVAPSEEALFFQYTELFFAAAARHPIVFFIDDLHWADRATISLLAHLARRIRNERILIVGTYRASDVDVTKHPIREARLELERYGVAEEMALEPLTVEAKARLIQDELGLPPTPELLDWLDGEAGSNPLFFGELLKWLVEQGLVREHRGEFALVRVPEDVEVPRSAESTIERRLSRLDPAMYRLLEYASVEGNEFGSTTLALLLGMDELELEEALGPLVNVHRLIQLTDTRDLPSGEPTSIYQFAHSLIATVLHRNLQGKRRILLHRRMAEILQRLYDGTTDSIAHRLAAHFEEGRLSAAAYQFAMIGAERASRLYAHGDAIALVRRALRTAQNEAQRTDALERLGDFSHAIGHYADALHAFAEARDLAHSDGNAVRGLALRRKLLAVERDHGGTAPASIGAQLTELAAEARALPAPAELCQMLWLLDGLPGVPVNDATAHGREALALIESLGDKVLIARAHYSLGRTLAFGPDPTAATPHLRRSLELHSGNGDRGGVGRCHNLLAVVHAMAGDLATASAEFTEAAAAFEAVGDPVNEASVRNNLGALLTRTGDWDRAERNLREALRLAERLDMTARVLHPLENLAELYAARARWTESREQWQELLERARTTGYWNAEVIARCGIGRCLLEEGDREGARRHERAARELLTGQDAWSDAQAAHHLLAARIAVVDGRIAVALACLEEAERALDSRDRFESSMFRMLRGEILMADDPDAAASLIEEAHSTFERLGTEPMRRRAESLLCNARGS